jgi:hypothetical protein
MVSNKKTTIVCFLISTGFASASLAQTPPLSLVTYSSITSPQVVDVAPAGPSVGDMYVRHGKVSLAPDGPSVGMYYSQATIVVFDEAAQISARSFNAEVVLPEGTIYKMDFVQSDHGRPMVAGHKHQGAIVGGTGKYAGIRGVYETELLESGKLAKTTHRFWLGQ